MAPGPRSEEIQMMKWFLLCSDDCNNFAWIERESEEDLAQFVLDNRREIDPILLIEGTLHETRWSFEIK